ncbi:MAG TPA: hypothetical protein PKD70_00640 [Saprospiraceae bacterium]|nr:hypothetical protein [Saprospiraceae bacterium]HMP12352.1 hypothetical protein [Saprospiraceae bacterium]
MKTSPILHGIWLLSLAFFTSCQPQLQEIPEQVMGLAPVYATTDWRVIKVSDSRAIQKLGKMYYKDGYIFAGERGQGIHIIDNRDPFNPRRLKFIEIAGNSDVAIKGNFLYANNLFDLVVLDISNLDQIRVVSRVEKAFPNIEATPLPDNYTGFFECTDPARGVVSHWEEQLLKRPQCWR